MQYIPLNCKTDYSVLRSLSQIGQIKNRLNEIGAQRAAICDYGNISGSVSFFKDIKDAICGVQLKIKNTNNYIALLAKNKQGWFNIVKITSIANSKDNFKDEPEIELIELCDLLTDDVIVIYLYPEENPLENSYYGIDLNLNGLQMRSAAINNGIETVAYHNSLIASAGQLEDLFILFCIEEDDILSNIKEKYKWYEGKNHHIMSYDEMIQYGYTTTELENTLKIGQKCESYKLANPPKPPKFPCPDGLNSEEYIRKLCIEGWNKKIKGKVDNEIRTFNAGHADVELGPVRADKQQHGVAPEHTTCEAGGAIDSIEEAGKAARPPHCSRAP